MSVTFSGLSSGLNTDRIIQQLLKIERRPQKRFRAEKTQIKNTQDAFQTLNEKVSGLLGNLDTLSSSDTFQQMEITNNKTDVLSASISDQDKVQPGTFDVFVEQLASNAKRSSGKQILDQNLVDLDQNEATLVSDFEQVEGANTLDLTGTSSTESMLAQLSKEVQTSGDGDAEFGLDLNDDGSINAVMNPADQAEEIDLDSFSSFQQLIDHVNGLGLNETGDSTGKDIDGDGNNERFQFGFNKSKDKFFLKPLDQDNTGGATLSTDDLQENISDASKGFLQQIGINENETVHHFANKESELGENLLSIDPSKKLAKNLFTSPLQTDSGEVEIKVNNTNITLQDSDTINDFLSKVNDKVEGVNATYNEASDKVTLQTEDTGQSSIAVEDVRGNLADVLNLRDSGDETGGQAAADIDNGTNSEVTIDGDTVTSDGNTVTFNGIKLDLKELHKESNNSGDPVKLEVSKDEDAIASDVQSFIDQFNSVMEFINKNNNSNPASEPGEESGDSGPFAGDSTIRRIKNTLTKIVTDSFEDATGSDVIQDANSVGIEQKDPLDVSDSDKGKLNFDTAAFKEALRNAPSDVEELFSADTSEGDSADGLATELQSYVDNGLTDDIDGLLPSRIDGFDRKIDNLNRRIEENEEHVQRRKKQLEAEFLKMEQLLTSLNSQQRFLSARL